MRRASQAATAPVRPAAFAQAGWISTQTWRDWLPLAGCLLVGASLRGWLFLSNSGLTMDSPEYVHIAESLARRGACPDAWQNHGYPALMLVARLFLPGREFPGRAVSLVASLALIALVYRLARRTLGRWAASLAGLLVAVHPTVSVYGTALMSDSAFLAMSVGALLLVDLGHAPEGGAALGLAFWVRPEAAALALGAAAGAGRRWASVLGIAALVGATYVGYLHWERGVWTLTPKLESQLRASQPEFRLPAAAPGTFSGLASAPPSASAPVSAAAAAVSRILPNLEHWPERFAGHAAQVLVAWPLPLLLLSALGWDRRRRVLLAPLAYLLLLPLVAQAPGPRFVLLLVPSLAIFAAAGCQNIVTRFPGRAAAVAAGVIVVLGMGLCWTGDAGRHALYFDDGPVPEMRAAGEWLHAHAPSGTRVMDRKAYVPFFAGMLQAQMPDNDLATIVAFARRTGCRYLVVEEYIALSVRPQLLPLLADPRFRAAEHQLRAVYARRDRPGAGIAIFEVGT